MFEAGLNTFELTLKLFVKYLFQVIEKYFVGRFVDKSDFEYDVIFLQCFGLFLAL